MTLAGSLYPTTLLAESDAALLDPRWHSEQQKFSRRDAALDPLLLAVTASAGIRTTRNHYHHHFFPGAEEESTDRPVGQPQDCKRMTYMSRQGPRRLRLQNQNLVQGKENDSSLLDPLKSAENVHSSVSRKCQSSLITPANPQSATEPISLTGQSHIPPIEVKCMARTRIPTRHGPVFLHLYHNNRDTKEHLAVVVDPAQYTNDSSPLAPSIRSSSLDAVWTDDETDMDRIVRGAYVGKLSTTSQHPSRPSHQPSIITDAIPSPLVRIHSECFTGETVGSMRCDCGEQLDEAIRLISQPISILNPASGSGTMLGRGAVIYLRQEGRGIGLLSKIRAYNLQDLGHDTVTANLMLGHQADERGYEIAAAILRDLGLGSEPGEGVRLLTNNPDKVQALEKEGVRVVERVPMVPKSWRCRSDTRAVAGDAGLDAGKVAGVTMAMGDTVRGEDLDKYLRTKILRMGHLLPLYLAEGHTTS